MFISGRCALSVLAATLTCVVGVGCCFCLGGSNTAPIPGPPPGPKSKGKAVADTTNAIDLPQAEPRPGTAIAVLVDTSGSMGQPVRDAKGQQRPKNEIAREALLQIVKDMAAWKAKHPDRTLEMGIYTFSSNVNQVLPMGAFDAAKASDAVRRIGSPNGGTAIGRALEAGAKDLYRSGCSRKFILCISDGENTSGIQPDRVARQLHQQTEGGINFNFVAFDTKANQFRFLEQVNGHVVEAQDGAQLQTELSRIYEKRILAEVPDEPNK